MTKGTPILLNDSWFMFWFLRRVLVPHPISSEADAQTGVRGQDLRLCCGWKQWDACFHSLLLLFGSIKLYVLWITLFIISVCQFKACTFFYLWMVWNTWMISYICQNVKYANRAQLLFQCNAWTSAVNISLNLLDLIGLPKDIFTQIRMKSNL